ncbi:MAG TPA: Flp pilus assembly protein CpaB [Candidatus Obscuribacterales bacterium]
MNPLRSLFMSLSRIPPAAMLLLVVGLAAVVSYTITMTMDTNRKNYDLEIARLQERARAKGKVVFAVKDIPEGETITSDAIEERELEVGKIPQDALSSGVLAAGRVAKFGIASGAIISQHDLAPHSQLLSFESRLQPGMRAVTFAVDTNSGVAGFISPQSHVDILAMVGSGADTKASPILSDIEVIAVGQSYQRQPGTATATPVSSVTVAVSPDDTKRLIKAVAASKLYLALRNAKDHTPIATVDVTALFPKPPAGTNAVALLPPPSELGMPPLPPMTEQLPGPNVVQRAPEAVRPAHEVEYWAGGRRDVITIDKR